MLEGAQVFEGVEVNVGGARGLCYWLGTGDVVDNKRVCLECCSFIDHHSD